jgi:hypothetical protein
MHATVFSIRFGSAAAVEFLRRAFRNRYKSDVQNADYNGSGQVKNAVAILSFMVAPQQLCHDVALRQFCAFLRACRAMRSLVDTRPRS